MGKRNLGNKTIWDGLLKSTKAKIENIEKQAEEIKKKYKKSIDK